MATHALDPVDAWLALIHAPGLGPRRILALLEHHGSAPAAVRAAAQAGAGDAVPGAARAFLRAADPQAWAADRRWLDQPAHHLIGFGQAGYPTLLHHVSDCPAALFVNGPPAVLEQPAVAIVGSRHPTPPGAANARAFAEDLARHGWVIVSGLARGIDAAAHQGALDAGAPTVAVMGTGPDRIYPAAHRRLAEAILAAGGALITEFPCGRTAQASHFPRRNRIISGLSRGVLVVEAARDSGSLITARQAGEQGREVFALPGSIHNPMAHGCHALIREGAKLVEVTADILDELGSLHGLAPPVAASSPEPADGEADGFTALPAAHQAILNGLGHDAADIDTLVARSGLTADQVSSMLVILELQGWIVSSPGGMYTRITLRG